MLNIHWKNLCWNSNTLATWWEELTHWKRPWFWKRLRARREGGDRGWDGWMASQTQWTWAWANSGRQWKTRKPGVLQSMGSQRVGYDWVTEQLQRLNPLDAVEKTEPSSSIAGNENRWKPTWTVVAVVHSQQSTVNSVVVPWVMKMRMKLEHSSNHTQK